MFCPKCRAAFDREDLFCTKCGEARTFDTWPYWAGTVCGIASITALVISLASDWLPERAPQALGPITAMFTGPLMIWSIQNLIRIRIGLPPAESGEMPDIHV